MKDKVVISKELESNFEIIKTGYLRFDILDDAAKVILDEEIVSAINLP